MNKEVLRERKESNLFEWRRYLQILDMLKDDRSQPYIAKKLGFKNASSIANILNRFQGLETLISEHTAVVEREAVKKFAKTLKEYRTYTVGGDSPPIRTFHNEIVELVDVRDIDAVLLKALQSKEERNGK